MAQDYHIYLHDVEGSSYRENKTQPFSVNKESAFSPEGYGEVQGIMDEDTGAAALSQVSPYLALVVAVAAAADKVISTGFSHLTEYKGHYEYEMGYNNFKTFVRHVTNPIGYLKTTLHQNFQWKKQNQQIEEEAKLLGNTIYAKTKIGV